MDINESLDFLQQNMDECMLNESISNAIDQGSIESLHQLQLSYKNEISNSQIFEFFEDTANKMDNENTLTLIQNITNSVEKFADSFDKFYTRDMISNLFKKYDENYENSRRIIKRARHFFDTLLPLFKNKKCNFKSDNSLITNLKYIKEIKKMYKIVKEYPELNQIYHDEIENFSSILPQVLKTNKTIIEKAFDNDINHTNAENIKKLCDYQALLLNDQNSFHELHLTCTLKLVERTIRKKLNFKDRREHCKFDYKKKIVAEIIKIERMIPEYMPKIADEEKSEELLLIYFIVDLPNIIQNLIQLDNKIFNKDENKTDDELIKAFGKYFNDKLEIKKNLLLKVKLSFKSDFLPKNVNNEEMSWCFISSVFYDKNKFKTQGKDPISIEYEKIIISIQEFSLSRSQNLFASFFKDDGPLIGRYNTLKDDYGFQNETTKAQVLAKARQEIGMGYYKERELKFLIGYILIFKLIGSILEQISLYNIEDKTKIPWLTFMSEVSNLDLMTEFRKINDFDEKLVLFFYAMVNHYLMFAYNNQKNNFKNDFSFFVKDCLLPKAFRLNNYESYDDLVGESSRFIEVTTNDISNNINQFIRKFEDCCPIDLLKQIRKEFANFLLKALLKYLYSKLEKDTFNRLSSDLENRIASGLI